MGERGERGSERMGDGEAKDTEALGPHRMTEGEFAGWWTWRDVDPFEQAIGPFFSKRIDGEIVCAFRAEPRHMNGGGFMHGGCMMSFADFALFQLSSRELGRDPAVTVSLNGEFLGPARPGERIEARGGPIQAGRSLVFVRGLLTAEGRPMLNFSGVVKRVGARK